MENDTRLTLKGSILNFTKWDDTIHFFVLKFYKMYNVYPNLLLASDYTYQKIDLYAQMHPERIMDPDGVMTIEASDCEYTGISDFSAVDYSLEFCFDNEITEGNFLLVFDEEPDFSGEPLPVVEIEEKQTVYQFEKTA